MNIDYTGYGYGSGGHTSSQSETANFRRFKQEMDKMSDYMQKLDPVLNRTIENMARAQVRNGATPEEARRAAFGSAQGQLLSDTMLAARRTGFLGHGDPINTGRNYLQGTASGGFQIDMLGPGGRSQGMGQGVRGGGLLAGQASQQLASGVMEQLYGKDSTDRRQLYGNNMEQSSEVFRSLAQRGALGNIGKLKTYGDKERLGAKAVDEKLGNARLYEKDALIRDALEGTTAGNVDAKIKEAFKKGDMKIVNALGDVKSASSTLVLDETNTKRIAEVVEETVKGITNLKNAYGELNNPQLMAQMEAITGIRITSKAEAKKAAMMTDNITNTAMTTGNDPRATMEMLLARREASQGRVANDFGADLGAGQARSAEGNEIAASRDAAALSAAQVTEAADRQNRESLNSKYGLSNKARSAQSFAADNSEQLYKLSKQHQAMEVMSGLAETTFKGSEEFTKAEREAREAYTSARTPGEAQAANSMAEAALRKAMPGVDLGRYFNSQAAGEARASANKEALMLAVATTSAGAAYTPISDGIISATSGGADRDAISHVLKAKLGQTGMDKLMLNDDKTRKTKAQRDEAYKLMIKEGVLSQDEATLAEKNFASTTSEQQIKQLEEIRGSAARGQSYHDQTTGKREAQAAMVAEQRHRLSGDDGKLTVKNVIKGIMGDGEGLKSPAELEFGLEAAHARGLLKRIPAAAKINLTDGIGKDEMDSIRKATGNKDFSAHGALGYDTEEKMLAASKDVNERDRIMRYMKQNTDLTFAGTDASMTARNKGDTKQLQELNANYQKAALYGAMTGVKNSDSSTAMDEIIETGKLKKGSQGLGVIKGSSLYDEKGRGYWGRTASMDGVGETMAERKSATNMAHFEGLGRHLTYADAVLSDDKGDIAIQLDKDSGGQNLRDLEAQYDAVMDSKAKILDTGSKGTEEKKSADEVAAKLLAAIEKLKLGSGEKQVVSHMTVTTMEVTEKREK